MSRWHFQRIFKAITGDTVKAYIRTRRFSVALEDLLATDRAIIDIAIDTGYESQESFTRAFKQNFSLTPGQFRALGESRKFMRRARIDDQYLQHINSGLSREPDIQHFEACIYVGLQTSYYGADSEKNNFADKLLGLWDGFLPRMGEVPNAIPDIGFGLIEQTANNSELLNYYSAVQVTSKAELPRDMVSMTVSAGRYAVFTHTGNPMLLDDTVNYIYGTWLPGSGNEHSGDMDIEIYGEGYMPDSSASVIHYAIPLIANAN
ncbi:UNVERIFIED_CONTAM: hypothetical protein GTU68_037230 [Idotea baltica]|nr:hypothetical protein [Idotea baltica]